MAAPEEHTPDLPACPSARGTGLLPPELRAWMVLLAATGAVEQRLRTVVKERLDVSHDEFLILCLLAEHPEEDLRMTRVAELLGRPKTRLTYQVACLQHAGLVTRRSVCGDKRGIEIALTEKARTLLREASTTLAGTVTEALAHVIGPEQCEAMGGLVPGKGSGDTGEQTGTGTVAPGAGSGTGTETAGGQAEPHTEAVGTSD
ncbi:MarR family transcriptional regulator [Streptomyces sp. SS7]|uniref:MarR family winged helix-turn-helix transcriptional regulator n=1 Tax=Streptomyces sp. SS7 TaxID=3108485 RepID=UPI0030EDA0F0